MARADLTLVVTLPDLRPDDVTLLLRAGDLLWWQDRATADALHDLSGRVARMLLTAQMRSEPTEGDVSGIGDIVPDVVATARAYYALPGNGVGGSLHVVLDDGNTDEASVSYCLRYAQRVKDEPGAALAAQLLAMTESQRRNVVARLHAPPDRYPY